jgi:hypothetical protein
LISYGIDSQAENIGTIPVSGGSTNSHTFNNLIPGTHYYFKVCSIDSGYGEWSEIYSVQTEGIKPANNSKLITIGLDDKVLIIFILILFIGVSFIYSQIVKQS